MKTNTLTIRLDEDLDKLLTKAAKQSGKNRSEIAREALVAAAGSASSRRSGKGSCLLRKRGDT